MLIFQEATFTLKLTKCEKYTSSATGEEMQKLTFQPVSDTTGVTEADTLKMVIDKPVVKNVVYVNKGWLCSTARVRSEYVYTVNEARIQECGRSYCWRYVWMHFLYSYQIS